MTYFKDQLDQLNKWEHLRLPLFRNEEVGVKLVALTKPVDDSMSTESLPAFTARQSHESNGTHENDLQLNQKLIAWGHTTPLEAVQFVFHVSGISKSLAGQWTRHRAGIGWTFRSTRYVSAGENKFIYPALEYIDNESKAKEVLGLYEKANEMAVNNYNLIVSAGVKNQEARRIMPVDWSTSCYCYINARSLRHFFDLRLSPYAEWEIRRLAYMMFNVSVDLCPTIFKDIGEKFSG